MEKNDSFQEVIDSEAGIENDIQALKRIARNMLITIDNYLNCNGSAVDQKDSKSEMERLLGGRMSLVNALSGIAELLFKLEQYEKTLASSRTDEEGHELSHLSENDKALIDSFLRKIRRSHFPEEDAN